MSKGKLSSSRLQKALDGSAGARNKAWKFREQIARHCEAVYGYDPASIDNDDFIDSCDGANGMCGGMSAEEFHISMIDALKHEGLPISKEQSK